MLGASRLFSQGWESLRRFIPPPQHEHPKEWSDFEYTAYVNVIIAILNAIQRSGHGGAVVLASQSAPFASEQSSPVRIKYRFASGSDSLQKLFVEFMKARHQLADFINLKESGDPNTSDKDVKSAVHDASVAELKLADTCTFVGKLSGTDGAIVLNSDLTLFGFGTEILLDKRIDLPVYEVENPIAKEEKHQIDGEQYGMRHRSAMRLCTNVTDIVVFVVSQDGDVSITWRQWGDNEVYFKKGIRITNMNMPG